MRIDVSTRSENGYNQISETGAGNSRASQNPSRNLGPIELQMLRNLPRLTSEMRIREQHDSAVGSQRAVRQRHEYGIGSGSGSGSAWNLHA